MKIKLGEKQNEHKTYLLDTENQIHLLKQNNNVKDLKIKEIEHNLLDLDKM